MLFCGVEINKCLGGTGNPARDIDAAKHLSAPFFRFAWSSSRFCQEQRDHVIEHILFT